MKLLTLLLALATGDTDRVTMPAWECRAVQMEMERAWADGGHVDRDDGARVVGAECIVPAFADLLTLSSIGPCEVEA